MKQVSIKSKRVKMPEPLWPTDSDGAKCYFCIGQDGRSHRGIMLGGNGGLPLPLLLITEEDIPELKRWLDRALAWLKDQNHEEDIYMLLKDPKKWDLDNNRWLSKSW